MRCPSLAWGLAGFLLVAAPPAARSEALRSSQDPISGDAPQDAEAPSPEVPPLPGPFGEELEVTEVLLDVVVTDAKGRVIPGLGREDFIVEEAGARPEITSVTFFRHRPGIQTPVGFKGKTILPDPTARLADRFFILFFHDPRAIDPRLGRQVLDVTRWMDRWFSEELAFNDYAAVLSYDTSLHLWTDFTNDRQRLLDAVRAVSMGDRAFGDRPTRDRRRGGFFPSLADNLPEGRELRRETVKIHGALQLVAEASRTVVGRKNLLFFSVGFGRPPERGFPTWNPDGRYYPQMMEALNDNNVAVYAIDLVPTTQQGSIQDRGSNQSLSQLAEDTGGAYYYHFNNFLTPLRDVEEATEGYYMLSYLTGVPTGKSGFRAVKVKTRYSKLRVRARRGYRYGDPKPR